MSLKGRLLCKKCLINDWFFRGGGSWSPDSCPKCDGTECVWYEDLNQSEKLKAETINKKFMVEWKKIAKDFQWGDNSKIIKKIIKEKGI